MCVCLLALLGLVGSFFLSPSDDVDSAPDVPAPNDLGGSNQGTGSAAAPKAEGPAPTTPHMGGSPRVTVMPVSTAASSAPPPPDTTPPTTFTTTPTKTTTTSTVPTETSPPAMTTTNTPAMMTTTTPAMTTTTTTAITTTTTTEKTTTTTTEKTTMTTITLKMTTTTKMPGSVKTIICTVSDTTTSEDMYPPDNCDYLFYSDVYPSNGRVYAKQNFATWLLFQRIASRRRNMEFGLSFDFRSVTLYELEDAAPFLGALRTAGGIKHYGLLTMVTDQDEYSSAISDMQSVIAKLKKMQGSEPRAKTVLAFGLYAYSADFIPTIKAEFKNVVNTFKVDFVIAITSTGWPTLDGSCSAVPPNSLYTDKRGYSALESHWFAVSATETLSNPSVITGLSFELSTLEYGMVEEPTSLNASVFQPCLSVMKKGREALCKRNNFTGGPENYLGDPIYAYGTSAVASKVLTLSEYNNTLSTKFLKAVGDFGQLRGRTAWLLYNVHSEGPGNECNGPPFTVLKSFRMTLDQTG